MDSLGGREVQALARAVRAKHGFSQTCYAVLDVLLDLRDFKTNRTRVRVETIAEKAVCSPRTVKRSTQKLEALGVIEKRGWWAGFNDRRIEYGFPFLTEGPNLSPLPNSCAVGPNLSPMDSGVKSVPTVKRRRSGAKSVPSSGDTDGPLSSSISSPLPRSTKKKKKKRKLKGRSLNGLTHDELVDKFDVYGMKAREREGYPVPKKTSVEKEPSLSEIHSLLDDIETVEERPRKKSASVDLSTKTEHDEPISSYRGYIRDHGLRNY